MSAKTLCGELGALLAQERLHVLFQPIVDVGSGVIYGYEALIRGPSDSPLHSPLNLFDTAIDCGYLVELDYLCRRLAIDRFDELDLPERLFVNVTPETILQAHSPRGRTLSFLQDAGISPDRVVIEITEHMPIKDYQVIYEAVEYYRNMGFTIAIDDLGSGYGGLRHWTELRPEYVKIDGHFAQNIHEDVVKRGFIRSMREIARELNSRLIVEGIESEDEYAAIASLGIELAQGYYLQRPTLRPPRELPGLTQTHIAVNVPHARMGSASSLLLGAESVPPDTPVPDIIAMFERNPKLRSLVVSKGDQALGIVRRHQIMDFYARRFIRELNVRKPVSSVMDSQPLIVRENTLLDQLSQLVTNQIEEDWERDFIITNENGKFLGIGKVIDLLRRMTELQIQYARYANPLTQLPGNVPINEHINKLIGQELEFIVAYCDLDSFKPYNDYYGYARGDYVIRELARLLSSAALLPKDFVGHIGGDDFVLILANADWHTELETILTKFAELTPGFYDFPERERGGIVAYDRQGAMCFYEMLSVSIGVVQVSSGHYQSHHDVAAKASEVKGMAKRLLGNSLFVDRRQLEEKTQGIETQLAPGL